MSMFPSLYARISLTPSQYEAFMNSPCADPNRFTDWQEWHARQKAAGNISEESVFKEDWLKFRGSYSVETWFSLWDDGSWMPKLQYDPELKLLQYGQLQFDANLRDFFCWLSVLRGAEGFRKQDPKDCIIVFDYFWEERETSYENARIFINFDQDGKSVIPQRVDSSARQECLDYFASIPIE